MFLCKNCHDKEQAEKTRLQIQGAAFHGWSDHIFTSFGLCECCKIHAACVDCKIPPKAKELSEK